MTSLTETDKKMREENATQLSTTLDEPLPYLFVTKATVVKEFKFEAMHWLPFHKGQCKNLHGHSYRVQVACSGPVQPETGHSTDGMVLDFSFISDAMNEKVIKVLDHTACTQEEMAAGRIPGLNGVIYDRPTTAENIAGWIVEQIYAELRGYLRWVRVWETATSYAEVNVEDVLLLQQEDFR